MRRRTTLEFLVALRVLASAPHAARPELQEGAERIARALGAAPSRVRLREVYSELCACLSEGRAFRA